LARSVYSGRTRLIDSLRFRYECSADRAVLDNDDGITLARGHLPHTASDVGHVSTTPL